MKKIKCLIICTLILICSGCVKYEVAMNINSDKSMNLEIIYAVEKSLSTQSIDKNQIEELKKQGYTIKDYNKDTFVGYTISKKIDNIDDVSTIQENEADLDITNKSEYMFKIKKGFFKNTYTYTAKTVNPNSKNTNNLNIDYSKKGMEMNLKVSLPYKALKSNATKIENDGKNLTWDLLKLKDERIFLKFEIYNIPNIVVSIIGTIGMIVIIYFIAKGKKKKDQYIGNFDIKSTI